MADKSRIEWTDATWNPVTGCLKVSAGCKNCYAERDWARLQRLPAYAGRAFTDVAVHEDRLLQPLRWKRPRRIFVNSLSDVFLESLPTEAIDKIFAVIGLAFVMGKDHVFQLLTKRAERMHQYLNDPDTVWRVTRAMKELGPELPGENSPPAWPLPNLWLGVSIEDQDAADKRVPLLLASPAHVRWVSAEPLLGPLRLKEHGLHGGPGQLDWVVVGGESGPNARPMHPNWARALRDECAAAGTSFLFKQWGEWVPRSACYHTFGDGSSCVDIDPEASRWRCIKLTEQGLNGRDLAVIETGDSAYMQKVGTRFAGRLLEGVEHNGYPKP